MLHGTVLYIVYVQVSGVSKEPVSIVVEEWEESQERAKDGGEEEEESMDVSFSEPVMSLPTLSCLRGT